MIDENELKIEELGFCLSLHCAQIDEKDNDSFKDLIFNFLNKYSGFWVKGTFWGTDFEEAHKSAVNFKKEYDEELNAYFKFISGIQTRVLGNIVIPDPTIISDDIKSNLVIISFRKIHYDFEILIFTISSKQNVSIHSLNDALQDLEQEARNIWQLFFINCDEKFNNRYYMPYTKLYFSSRISNDILPESLINTINNKSSAFYNFLKDYFCVKGVDPHKLPISIVNEKFYVIRHHSYYFSQELSEKFLILPTEKFSDLGLLIKTIDIFSSIEFYHTKFFNLIKGVYDLLNEIDEQSKIILDSAQNENITALKPEEADKIFINLVDLTQSLLPKYSRCDAANSELEHILSDAGHLIENITKSTIYSQASEKPLIEGSQGAVESIGLELQMRIKEVTRNIPRSIGKSYHNLNAITNLIKTYHEYKHLTKGQKELLQSLESQIKNTHSKTSHKKQVTDYDYEILERNKRPIQVSLDDIISKKKDRNMDLLLDEDGAMYIKGILRVDYFKKKIVPYHLLKLFIINKGRLSLSKAFMESMRIQKEIEKSAYDYDMDENDFVQIKRTIRYINTILKEMQIDGSIDLLGDELYVLDDNIITCRIKYLEKGQNDF